MLAIEIMRNVSSHDAQIDLALAMGATAYTDGSRDYVVHENWEGFPVRRMTVPSTGERIICGALTLQSIPAGWQPYER